MVTHKQIAFGIGSKVEKFLLPFLALISSPSPVMIIQIVGGKITENLGFESPIRKVKLFCPFFSFHFQILHSKLGIFDFSNFLISYSVI